jgi:hypothetical protein
VLKSVILFLFSTLLITAFSQVLNNTSGSAFELKPSFDPKYIQANKIEAINTTYFTKQTGDVMRKTGEKTRFQFNEKGYLVSQTDYVNYNYQSREDSVVHSYEYTTSGYLSKHKKRVQNTINSVYYTTDTLGNIIREDYYKSVVKLQNNRFVFSDSLLDFETMRYKVYPAQRQKKKIVYNSYGNPYLDFIYYYDSENQIIELDKKYKMTSEIHETKYFYNENKQVDSIVRFSSLTPNETESVYFIYGPNDNVLDKKVYVNKKLIYHTEFIYNEKTGMLSSILKQDIASNFLTIIRFETIYKEN